MLANLFSERDNLSKTGMSIQIRMSQVESFQCDMFPGAFIEVKPVHLKRYIKGTKNDL